MGSQVSLNKYDSVEFTLATGQTNYDLDSNQAGSFNNVPVWKRTLIRTNIQVSIKLNSTSNDAITISPLDSPLEIDWQEITNIYITNASGSTASLKFVGVE